MKFNIGRVYVKSSSGRNVRRRSPMMSWRIDHTFSHARRAPLPLCRSHPLKLSYALALIAGGAQYLRKQALRSAST